MAKSKFKKKLKTLTIHYFHFFLIFLLSFKLTVWTQKIN